MDGVFKALAHPARRRILTLLKAGPKSAGALAEAFDFSKPTLSEHLNKLLHAGLVRMERRGGSNIYRINTSVIEDLFQSLFELRGEVPEQEGGHG